MALALLGVVLVLEAVSLTAWTSKRIQRQGRAATEAWRLLPQSGTAWIGIILVVGAVSPTTAGALMVAVLVGATIQIIRGIRQFPAVWRLIGDPDAWRGHSGG